VDAEVVHRAQYAHARLPALLPFLLLRAAPCSDFKSRKVRVPFSSRLETRRRGEPPNRSSKSRTSLLRYWL
jgi:hypothetical protein